MSNRGGTPLHVAISQHAHELVQLLIDRGAEVGARTSSNETSLHSAAEKNFVCGAQLLIEHGVDVDASSIYGHRPLHFAVFNKSHDVARLPGLSRMIPADAPVFYGERLSHSSFSTERSKMGSNHS